MSPAITTPKQEELDRRLGRYDALQAMSTAEDLDWVPLGAKDVIFARKIMPIILEPTKSPFGNIAPITSAGGMTMFISIMPPGQGPCLHSHNSTYETFMVLEGEVEYHIGDPIEHRRVLKKWDTISVPPRTYRGFRNVGTVDAVQLTVISGIQEGQDDVSVPQSVADELQRDYGAKVVDAFKTILRFDPKA